MKPEVLKYILDIESVIQEIENTIQFVKHDFSEFQNNHIAIRAIERDLEILGEATKKLRELGIELHNNNRMIGLRNIIAHAYDIVDNELLWNIITGHIPELKKEILRIKG